MIIKITYFLLAIITSQALAQTTNNFNYLLENDYKIAKYKVIDVLDGDTISVVKDNEQQESSRRFKSRNSISKTSKASKQRVRLSGIDAPEITQQFGIESRNNLKYMLNGKQVVIYYKKMDYFERILGVVIADGEDLNLQQIKTGLAFYYKQYEIDLDPIQATVYQKAETEAKKNKLGIWEIDNFEPPWEYRLRH